MGFCLRLILGDNIRNSHLPALHSFHCKNTIWDNVTTLWCALNEDLREDLLSSLQRKTASPKLIHFYLKDTAALETMTVFLFPLVFRKLKVEYAIHLKQLHRTIWDTFLCAILSQISSICLSLDSLNHIVYTLHIFIIHLKV